MTERTARHCESCNTSFLNEDEVFRQYKKHLVCSECWQAIQEENKSGHNYYVNVYMIDQNYGGPEEGGRWYQTGEFVRCIGVFKTRRLAWRAHAKVQRLVIDKLNEGRKPISSVASTGVYSVQVDQHYGRDYPNRRPIYE